MEAYAPTTLRIARTIPSTPSEGPFRRFAVWVQGCSILCPGCCNPEMQDPGGGSEVQVSVLIERILETHGIEGVTLLGGEPFDQAASLAGLARAVRCAGLGVMAFSGYTLGRLVALESDAIALLGETDVLIAGPYLQGKHIRNARWVGSSNQTVHFLTSRYRECAGFKRPGQSVHISFSEDSMTITGFPDLFPEEFREGN